MAGRAQGSVLCLGGERGRFPAGAALGATRTVRRTGCSRICADGGLIGDRTSTEQLCLPLKFFHDRDEGMTSTPFKAAIEEKIGALEAAWRARTRVEADEHRTGATQFFAWQADEEGQDTVICVGSNYGQGAGEGDSTKTEEDLSRWRRNYCRAALAIVGAWESTFREHLWLVGASPPLRPKLFVMTNLVPAITRKQWTELPDAVATQLIAESDASSPTGDLMDLARLFPHATAVGHGISPPVLAALPKAIRKWPSQLLYANLSYPRAPSSWDQGSKRFRFGGRPPLLPGST